MLKRLEGVVMIVNTLMPLILIGGLVLIGWALVHAVKSAAQEPLARIDASIERMEQSIGDARQAAGLLTHAVVEGVAKPIRETSKTIASIPASVHIKTPDISIPKANLPLKPNVEVKPKAGIPPVAVRVWMSDLSVEMPTIKGIAIPETPIPGLTEVKKVFGDVFGALEGFVDVLRRIASIGTLGDEVTQVLAATGDLIDAVAQATGTLLTVLLALFWFGVFWFLLSYVLWAQRRLRIGWALARGVDAPLG